jgi:hypothetical protein
MDPECSYENLYSSALQHGDYNIQLFYFRGKFNRRFQLGQDRKLSNPTDPTFRCQSRKGSIERDGAAPSDHAERLLEGTRRNGRDQHPTAEAPVRSGLSALQHPTAERTGEYSGLAAIQI